MFNADGRSMFAQAVIGAITGFPGAAGSVDGRARVIPLLKMIVCESTAGKGHRKAQV